MITRRGAGIIAVAIAVFFLASTTRVGWVHLADAVLWGVVLVSLVVPWISMPGLAVERLVGGGRTDGERDLLPGPVEGDDVPVRLVLNNPWWLPRFLVSISYPVTVAGTETVQRSIFFWSSPRRTADAEGPVHLHRRGQHVLGHVTIEVTGPFGMFRRRRRLSMRHGVLAYPKWEPMHRIGILDARLGENEGRRKSRTGMDPAGTRNYVPGDPYRSIHWRNSARSGRLSVREFDTWNDRAFVFAIDDVNVLGSSPESSLDIAARVAGSCGRLVEMEGGSVSLATSRGESPVFLSWAAFMESLARLEPAPAGRNSLANAIAGVQPGRRLLAILGEAGGDAGRAVAAAHRRGVSCAALVYRDADAGPGAGSIAGLRQSGVPVVEFGPNELDRVISTLELGAERANTATGSGGRFMSTGGSGAVGRAA